MPSKTQDKNRYSTSQLLNFASGSYLDRTSRPVYALVFLLPFIIFYEIGTLLINTDILSRSQIRVVAFVWLQDLLDYAGFDSKFTWIAAPLAVLVILLALQLTSRTSWKVRLKDILPMAGECVVLAIPLIVLSLLLNRPATTLPQGDVPANAAVVSSATAAGVQNYGGVAWPEAKRGHVITSAQSMPTPRPQGKSPFLVNVITGIGAGIYEELIFRLILVCALMLLFQDIIGLTHTTSMVIAIGVSAALFSLHHHIIFMHGRFDQTAVFSWSPFLFRTVAGVYFAGLFAIRGFGITAGTHAFYDILAAAMNAFFFGAAE
ncbi:MAG: CPBP family intramembrane metalloprotease [Sedimentisphaerales bacterium]|nr:CPBP family intramembrane metalloprotease [Sedimentisphaerales bacterium]